MEKTEQNLYNQAKKEMLNDFKKNCLNFYDDNHFDVKNKETIALWYNKQYKTLK